MPTIEEVLDSDVEGNGQGSESLSELLASSRPALHVPKDFIDPDWAVGSNAATLISWRNRTDTLMRKILDTMGNTDQATTKELFVPLVEVAVPFTGSRDWVKAETRGSAQGTSPNAFFLRSDL